MPDDHWEVDSGDERGAVDTDYTDVLAGGSGMLDAKVQGRRLEDKAPLLDERHTSFVDNQHAAELSPLLVVRDFDYHALVPTTVAGC